MTTFEKEVRRRCQQQRIDPDAVTQAIDYHREENRTENFHAKEAVNLARHFQAVADTVSRAHASGQEDFRLPRTPLQLATARELEAALQTAVASVRFALFGDGEAHWPLGAYSDAVAWLESVQATGKTRKTDWAKADRLAAELQAVYPWTRITYTHGGLELGYAREGSKYLHVLPVREDSVLWPLAKLANDVEKGSGVRQPQMVAHVLCGLRLSLPRVTAVRHPVRVVLDNGLALSREPVTVTFHTPELTFEELRLVHRQVRRDWSRRRFTELDAKLTEAVQRLGGVPDNPRGFWQRVAEELRFRGKPESLARRWRRLNREKQLRRSISWVPTQQSEADDGEA